MFSLTAEYAFRAVLHLGRHPEAPQTARDISREMKIPPDYLAKILGALSRAGIITSRRGRLGGSTLSRSGADISLLDILNAVDPIKRIESCPLGMEDHDPRLCPLHGRLDRALQELQQTFSKTTLKEILEQPSRCPHLAPPSRNKRKPRQ